jgi:murein tripeptide amidase MpaA
MLTALLLTVALPSHLLTRAEQTNFVETARYEETLDYCRRLEKESPWIRVTSFGRSPEGRDLILVIASKERAFDPAAAAKTGKPIVLIQAGIHAGEIDGKDAGMMLLRDIAVTRQMAALLDHAVILFMPIYNVDGHERFGPYNRINQDGPKEMGWRVTSRNLNLNRDYMKADAVETRAWLRVFTTWWPDLTIDCHVTDGADYRYDVTYSFDSGFNTPPGVAYWIETAVNQHVVPSLSASGHLPSSYIALKDDTDPAAGLQSFGISPPRFSTGYTVLQNRPSFLIETHMLKNYRTRVLATYDTLRAWLEEVNRDPESLRRAVREADAAAARPGKVPLVFRPAQQLSKVQFKGVEYRRELSEISGAVRIIYGGKPMDLEVEQSEGMDPVVSVDKPLAYIVPPQWTEVIEVLKAHGLKLQRLTAPATASVDMYRLTDPNWAAAPFEGRHSVTFKTELIRGRKWTFPSGSIVVPTDQRSSTVAVKLLDPQGSDSLVSWGFFDTIFEQKEYAEAYVMEKVAREMLDKDPALRAEFEKKLDDPDFAGSPYRRLDFFFRRSPWWDDRIGLYPVGLLTVSSPLPVEAMP